MKAIDTEAAPSLPGPGEPDMVVRAVSASSATLGLLLLAIMSQALGHVDCDVSWFITFAEKYIDGSVPYVDVTDPNLPSAFLSLVPPVLLAAVLHIAPEPVVVAYTFLLAAASLAFCAYILSFGKARSRLEAGLLLNGAVFLLLVSPALVFAEREHFALLAMAPAWTLLVVRANGGRPPMAARLVAGALAGPAVWFKPHFALALALPLAALAWRDRSARWLFGAESVTALVVAAAHYAAIPIFFPAYYHYALPIALDLYAHGRDSWSNLAFHSLAPVNLALLIGLLLAAGFPAGRRGRFAVPTASLICAFASLGFLLTFLVQGKGWTNHAYPGVVLACFAWMFLALDGGLAPRSGLWFKFLFLPLFLAAPTLFGWLDLVADVEEHPGLRAAVVRLSPAHPSVIAMARQLDFGHPLTRQLAGRWAGRPNALWVSSFAAQLLRATTDPASRQSIENYRRQDLAGFAEDVRREQPDVILVESRGTRLFVESRAESAGALSDYTQAGAVDEIEIWTRKRDERSDRVNR